MKGLKVDDRCSTHLRGRENLGLYGDTRDRLCVVDSAQTCVLNVERPRLVFSVRDGARKTPVVVLTGFTRVPSDRTRKVESCYVSITFTQPCPH